MRAIIIAHGSPIRSRSARSPARLARALGLDDDLAEALALAHDLGHTPFGHTGEEVLDELMLPYGGFDHNAQALRIVTKLERRYADIRWAEPQLGGARRARQAQWSAARGRTAAGCRVMPSAGLPLAMPNMMRQHDLELADLRQRRGAGRGARRRHRL